MMEAQLRPATLRSAAAPPLSARPVRVSALLVLHRVSLLLACVAVGKFLALTPELWMEPLAACAALVVASLVLVGASAPRRAASHALTGCVRYTVRPRGNILN